MQYISRHSARLNRSSVSRIADEVPFCKSRKGPSKKYGESEKLNQKTTNPSYRRKQKINKSMPFKYSPLLLIFLHRSHLPSDSCIVVDTLFARHVSLTYAGCIFILLLLKHQCENVLPCSVSAISHLTSQTYCSRKCDTELVPNLWHHNSFCCCAHCNTSIWLKLPDGGRVAHIRLFCLMTQILTRR
jgi:hypothetical protein